MIGDYYVWPYRWNLDQKVIMFPLAMVQFVQVCCQVKMSRYCMIFIKLRRVEAAFQLCQTYSCEPLVLERLWVSSI